MGRPNHPKVFEEIEGSRPKKNFYPKDFIDIMNVKDINDYLQFKTKRSTNPLNPKYTVHDENNMKIEIGEIEKSMPLTKHPLLNKEKDFSLKSNDI